MQANWSLILNVLLLIGVGIAITRVLKARKQSLDTIRNEPSLEVVKNPYEDQKFNDDIIAVRKITTEPSFDTDFILDLDEGEEQTGPYIYNEEDLELEIESESTPKLESDQCEEAPKKGSGHTLMMFLLAKKHRQFAGYELLQTLLAAGLRFGEDGLFHRHRQHNGQGAVLCSLAAATETGVFDLQNMGGFSVRGLCVYMRSTNNPDLDAERFSVLLDTARQLRDGLDAYLLDDKRAPLNEESLARYQQLLQINSSQLETII